MIGRHVIFAGLFAAASFANASTVEASAATVQPAWSFNAGLGGAGEMTASQSMIAGPGSWSAHSRMGDVGSSSTMLFSQRGASASAPAQLSSTTASSVSTTATGATAAPAAVQLAVASPAAAETIIASPAAAESIVPSPDAAEMVVAAPAPAELAAIAATGDAPGPVIAAALAADIPEPATGMLMLAGLLGAGFLRRRRN